MPYIDNKGRMSRSGFLFSSELAIYPAFRRVAEIIVDKFNLNGYVFAPEEYDGSSVYESSRKFEKADFDTNTTSLKVHFIPVRKGYVRRFGFKEASFNMLLRQIRPDYIWIHSEFWEGIARQFLWHYRLQRHPRIIARIATNNVKGKTSFFSLKWPFVSRTRFLQMILWSRLNGVVAVSAKSMECARRMGLPDCVPIVNNYHPVLGPDDAADIKIDLPWRRDSSFTIGFAGLFLEQKGWKVLLDGVERLPERFKVVLVGDGPQKEELLSRISKLGLRGRAYYAGWLPQQKLLATYPLFDVLVLPSVTLPPSPEQFGCVLAEAMACGVPVIGSNSGAIPETVGQAGLIVPEGDPDALAKAIFKMSEDDHLRKRAIAWGLERYRTHYSCEAYARSIVELLHIP